MGSEGWGGELGVMNCACVGDEAGGSSQLQIRTFLYIRLQYRDSFEGNS